MSQQISPATRLISLDALRGVALLGILMMNIIAFAYPRALYDNPFALGPLSAVNEWQWFLVEMFFAEKFYALFAALFGAGIAMMAERQPDPINAKQVHYRRMFWLLLIGLLHAYGLWWGDILVTYAIGGMLIFKCRNWSVKKLLGFGFFLQSILMLLLLLVYYSWGGMSDAEQLEVIHSISPPLAKLQQEIAAYQGNWWQRASMRVDTTLDFHVNALIAVEFRMCGLMLVGMALFKLGILTASRSLKFYRLNGLLGVIIGTLICGAGAALIKENGVLIPEFMTVYRFPNYWGALFLAWGYVCLVMWLVKVAGNNWQGVVVNYLAPVGQMALTNYLLQTLLCCAVFYGWGLGLFGELQRSALTLIVLSIWAVQLVISRWWLSRFNSGPMERIWRNLTQRRWQPVLQRRVRQAV